MVPVLNTGPPVGPAYQFSVPPESADAARVTVPASQREPGVIAGASGLFTVTRAVRVSVLLPKLLVEVSVTVYTPSAA